MVDTDLPPRRIRDVLAGASSMKIHIYTRDEQGLVRYHGDHDYDSREQVLEYYSRASEPAESENMAGWPHSRVTWHGNIGFGESGE